MIQAFASSLKCMGMDEFPGNLLSKRDATVIFTTWDSFIHGFLHINAEIPT